jgi:hypothetical protein
VVLRAEKLSADYYYVRTPLFERWFALDAKAAAEWARTHPDDRDAWLSWAHCAPDSALAEVHAHPRSSMARDTFEEAIKTLTGNDKRATAAKLATLPADPARDSFLSKTITNWAKDDPEAAFLFAKQLPDAQRMIAITDTALRAWIARDPAAAKKEVEALAQSTPNRARAIGLVASLADALAKNDPARALQWVNGLPNECRGAAVYTAVARTWAKTDPVAALEWCIANGVDAGARLWTGGWGSNGIVREAMEQHPTETLSWIESLPSDENRARLLEQALTSRARLTAPDAKPDDAARLVALMATLPAEAQGRVAYHLGARTAEKGKIEEVHTWIDRLPDPQLRGAAIEAAVASRFGGRPNDKEQMVAQFAARPERDAALRGIISKERESEPAQAAQTALRISDPQTRHDAIDNFVIDWLHRDPSAARQWLVNTSGIPKEWATPWLDEAARNGTSF